MTLTNIINSVITNNKDITMSLIYTRKKNWDGHILRGDGLLKDVIEGRMEGKIVRGKRRICMIEEDRVGWRSWTP